MPTPNGISCVRVNCQVGKTFWMMKTKEENTLFGFGIRENNMTANFIVQQSAENTGSPVYSTSFF